MNKTTLKLLSVGLVIVLITVMSVISMNLSLRPTESEKEKRMLSQFPEFSFSALFNGRYFADISTWFSDTMPFREEIIDINNGVQTILGTNAPQRGFQENTKNEIPEAEELPPATLPLETLPPATLPPSSDQTPSLTESTPSVPADSGELPAHVETIDSILIAGNAGYEYYNFSQNTADNYAGAVNAVASRLEGKAVVYDMIVPTSMDIVLDSRIREKVASDDQNKAIDYIENKLLPDVRRVSIFDILAAHRNEYIYFRTDHHWTGLGAYYAYMQFCSLKGQQPVSTESCIKQRFDGFLGTFANKDRTLSADPDYVETFMPPGDYKISITDKKLNVNEGNVIYDESNAAASLKYGAFIWGDNAFSVIEDKAKASGESCLLIKESFGNALAPLLAANYKYLYIIDYRHYNGSICALAEEKGINDIVFCNNISMTRSQSLVNQLIARI